MGLSRHAATEDLASIAYYERAIELDPNFAVAYGRLGTVYGNMGEAELAERYHTKAFELRDRASEPEKLYITAYYYLSTGQYMKALQTWEMLKQTFTRNLDARSNLAGIQIALGRFDEALENGLEDIRMDPDSSLCYWYAACAYMAMNRLDDAKAILQGALERKIGGASSIHFLLSQIALAQDDRAAAAREDALARVSSEFDLQVIFRDADSEPERTFAWPRGDHWRSRIRWTPDGQAVTYNLDRGGVSNIWVQPLAGGPARQLTNFAADRIWDFDWAPDNRLILARGPVNRDLVLIRNRENR